MSRPSTQDLSVLTGHANLLEYSHVGLDRQLPNLAISKMTSRGLLTSYCLNAACSPRPKR